MGAFLHDLGKTGELCSEHGVSYTDEGQLIGHLRSLTAVRTLVEIALLE